MQDYQDNQDYLSKMTTLFDCFLTNHFANYENNRLMMKI